MEIIINKEKISLNVADTFQKRLFGLMGKRHIQTGLFFPKTRSIHTFFMKTNIDIIMLDKNNKIIYFEKNVSKNRIIIKKKAYHTIELPSNTINNLNLGEEITIC